MKPARPVVLWGVKHCGKSTLGAALAERWGIPLVDTDRLLEEEFARRNGRSASTREIFRELGEEAFRRFEADTVASLSGGSVCRVIALGGGAAVNPFLPAEVLRDLGFRVFLDVSDEVAFARVLRGGLPPFLAGAPDPFAEFQRINAARRPGYLAAADLVFLVTGERPVAEVAAELAGRIEEEINR